MAEYIAISEQVHKRWDKELTDYGILYLYAMTGYGKTVQAESFAKDNFKEYARMSAESEYFMEEVTAFLSGHKKPNVRTLLILDDLQWLRDAVDQKTLFELLIAGLGEKPRIRILLLSRTPLPAYLTPLQVTKQLVVENREALTLDKEQIRELIMKEQICSVLGEEQIYSLIQKTTEATKGYGLAVHSFLLRMMEYPKDETTAVALARQDVWNYMDIHLFEQWTNARREAAITLSVFDSFTTAMAEELLGMGAQDVIRDFMSVGSFLIFQAPDTYSCVPFFLQYLKKKLQERPESERKALYERAAQCYERKRDYEQTLRCYKEAGRLDKMAEFIVLLSENADGCSFAKISEHYLKELPTEWEEREPRILGAKVMLAAYRMKPEESRMYLAKLKDLAEQEKKSVMKGNALETYIRTVIACPCGSSEELKDNFALFTSYVTKHGIQLKHIMPTGNMPSLINGGLDLLSWEKNKTLLYPVIKAACELFIGTEAIGIADASIGEAYYEQNNKTRAMASLTKALSAANLRGSIRVQYAATGIMARIFTAEEQLDTAIDTLENIRNKAKEQHFNELLPNIEASLIQCALYKNDSDTYQEWLEGQAVSEHEDFYITFRYQLFIKAKVYTALGREMEALYTIGLLQEYTKSFGRIYFDIELSILQAIILYRRGENWQEILLTALDKASEYGLIRIFADYGAALLPLWKDMKWGEQNPIGLEEDRTDTQQKTNLQADPVKVKDKYLKTISREMKTMADFYPEYLKEPRHFASLTDKELVVLKLMARGLNNTQLAEELELSLGTIKFHVKNIMTKLEAENRTVAVKIAQEENIL